MTVTEGTDKLAKALLRPINPAVVIFLGIYTVLWGLWVASPLWSVFAQAKMFGTLAQVAPEWFWGCLAILCGLVICYGAVKRSYMALVRGASVAFFHWLIISMFYFTGDPLNTGGITALVLAIYAAFIWLNIKVNFKDDKQSDKILR